MSLAVVRGTEGRGRPGPHCPGDIEGSLCAFVPLSPLPLSRYCASSHSPRVHWLLCCGGGGGGGVGAAMCQAPRGAPPAHPTLTPAQQTADNVPGGPVVWRVEEALRVCTCTGWRALFTLLVLYYSYLYPTASVHPNLLAVIYHL